MLSPCPEGKQRRSKRRARGKENALKRTLANFIGEKRLRTTDKYRGWIHPIIRVQGTRLSASETAESTKRVHLEAFPQELMNLLNEVVVARSKESSIITSAISTTKRLPSTQGLPIILPRTPQFACWRYSALQGRGNHLKSERHYCCPMSLQVCCYQRLA